MNLIFKACSLAAVFATYDVGIFAFSPSKIGIVPYSSTIVHHKSNEHNKVSSLLQPNQAKCMYKKDDKVNKVPSRRDFIIKHASSATITAASVLTLRPQNSNAATTSTLTKDEKIITTKAPTSNILCDPSVSIFQHPSKKRTIYLLGTAHISSKSADAAAQLVRDMKPNAVFVELDAKRVGRAIPKPNPETWPVPPSSSSNGEGDGNSVSITVSNNLNGETISQSIIQPQQQQLSEDKRVAFGVPKFLDFREMALRKGSEVVGNSIKGLYSKLESEGFKFQCW